MGSNAVLLFASFAAGIAYADRGGSLVPGLAPALLLAAGAGLLAGVRTSLRRGLAAALIASAAFAAGHGALAGELARARAGAERVASVARGAPLFADARVRARRSTRFGEEVELVDVRSLRGESPLPDRLLLHFARGERASRAERLLWPGVRARLALRVQPLTPARNPGLPDRERALARRGIGARARLVKSDWVVALASPRNLPAQAHSALAARRAQLVERIAGRLDASVSGAGLARSLALGDRRALPESTREAFGQLGLAHLVSVSGLHIGFVALPCAWLVARLRVYGRPHARPVRSAMAPIAAGAFAATAYAGLTGASLPTLRASLLFLVFGGLRILGRSISPGAALAAIALALLASDPASLFDLGAQLSFAACAALIAGGLWGRAPARAGTEQERPHRTPPSPRVRLRTWAADSARASLSVSLFCLPLIEAAGLPRALWAPVVNLVAIPWTGFVVMPSAMLASLAVALAPEDLAERVLAALLWPAASLEAAAAACAVSVPTAWLSKPNPGQLPLIPAVIAIATGLAAVRARRLGAAILLWLVVGGLGIAGPGPIRFGDIAGPRVVVFDVGQADAILLSAGAVHWLIDTGSGDEGGRGGGALLRSLRALGVERLAGLVITHGDLDHRGGAPRILESLPVETLWLPERVPADPVLDRLAAQALRGGTPVRRVAAGDHAGRGSALQLEVLWPERPSVGPSARQGVQGPAPTARSRRRNAGSIVLRAELAGHAVLLMGDVDAEVESVLLRKGSGALQSELLKVAHHGSRSSSSASFLAQSRPRIALLSAPCEATRGLPSPEVLARLRQFGSELGWTGRDGALVVDWAGPDGMRMQHWAPRRRCDSEVAASSAATGSEGSP